MPLTRLIAAPVALLALAGCQYNMDREADETKAPAATIAGEARNCISLAALNSTRVHDDYTIDFKVGSQLYRNTLPNRCPGLGFEKAITYETSLTQLCSTDIVYVLRDIGGSFDRGAGCGLGEFVPINLVEK